MALKFQGGRMIEVGGSGVDPIKRTGASQSDRAAKAMLDEASRHITALFGLDLPPDMESTVRMLREQHSKHITDLRRQVMGL